ncbi:MAG: methionyl-tRNA formyltransferase [Rickettsiales bacterium]|nr:methionyl-tRNA formyltransferase [Rickettsiales bacterium]
MKVILMGTPDFVVPIFEAVANEHDVISVFTRAPKPAGRRRVLAKTPAHVWAESKNFPVYTDIKKIIGLPRPDYIIVAAYGVILKQYVMDLAPCLNIHPSLLPKYRGAAPIISAVMNGDCESGVCLMKMAAEVDAGDILMCEKFSIGENETTADIEKKAAAIAARLILDYLESPEKYPRRPQVGIPTFTKKIMAADAIIDWKKTPTEIHNKIRAVGGRTKINGTDVKILETKIEDGKLKIVRLQPAGKNPMMWADFENGRRGIIKIGE